jgi:hypothetical protein
MVVGMDTIAVFEDRREADDWRVEYFDDDVRRAGGWPVSPSPAPFSS